MIKRLSVFAALVALIIGAVVAPGSAASTVTQNFLLTSPGATPVLAFSGQLQCEVQINGPNSSIAATPQYSADGVTWHAATGIGGGSIAQPGVYIGTNPSGAGYTSLRLSVSSFGGSQLSGQLICGDSLPASGAGGGGVTSIVAGVCTSPNPGVGTAAVDYICDTPGPQATPSPSATGCGVWNGSWPYNLDTTTCSGGGGGVTAVTGSGNIAVSAGATPNVTITNAPTFTGPLSASTLTGTGLTSGNCLQASTGGLVTDTGSACGSGGGGGGLATPAAAPTSNPTPNAGYIQLTGGVVVGPAPDPRNAYVSRAFQVATNSGGCSGIVSWGTQSGTIQGVRGEGFSLSCNGGSPSLAIDQSGNLGTGQAVTASRLYASDFPSLCPGLGGGLLYSCAYTSNTDQGAIALGTSGSAAVDYCIFDFGHTAAGYLGANCPFDLSSSTKNVGEVICTVASGTSCTQTATVRSGAKCTASMETTDSTLAGPYYAPSVHTATTTLTVTMTAFTLGSGNLAANYWCP